eukprot:716917-Prymnesium_polylepis.1
MPVVGVAAAQVLGAVGHEHRLLEARGEKARPDEQQPLRFQLIGRRPLDFGDHQRVRDELRAQPDKVREQARLGHAAATAEPSTYTSRNVQFFDCTRFLATV